MKYYKRKWLAPNIQGQDSFISAEIETSEYGVDARIKLADCSRPIFLDFDSFPSGKRSLQQKLRKLDTLIQELENFREKYIEAISEVMESTLHD